MYTEIIVLLTLICFLFHYLFVGVLSGFSTVPFILSITLGSFTALEGTVTLLLKPPMLLVLYLTLIVPVWPGITGSLVQLGVVHPHDAFTDPRIRGSLPTFLNSKTQYPSAPFCILP